MKKYYPLVDVLRIVSMLGIVGCHLDLRQMTYGAGLINYYSDMGVGIFSMLAGYFFFKSEGPEGESYGTYFRRRARRLLLPYLVWTIVFVIFSNAFHIWSRGTWDKDLLNIHRLVDVLFLGASATQLWFVICLFYVQSLLYLVRGWVFKMSVVGCVLSVLGILMLSDCWPCWFARYPLRLFGFFLIGSVPVMIEDVRVQKWQKWGAALIFILGMAFHPLMTNWRYASSLLMVIPIGLWATCRACPPLPQTKSVQILRSLGGMMFTVYFVHPLFTVFQREIITRMIHGEQGVMVFLFDQFMAFLLSVAFAVSVRKITKRWVRKGEVARQ